MIGRDSASFYLRIQSDSTGSLGRRMARSYSSASEVMADLQAPENRAGAHSLNFDKLEITDTERLLYERLASSYNQSSRHAQVRELEVCHILGGWRTTHSQGDCWHDSMYNRIEIAM